jgi:RNA polymerase sigma-70 factor (ECF subfamily)
LVKARTTRTERFEDIVDEVFEPLQRYLYRRMPADSVDDVLSETLMVVWRRLDEVPSDASLPWCYGVARRVLSNHRRGDQRRLRLVDRLTAEPRSVATDPQGIDDGDPHLEAALEQLSDQERELIHLWAWEQLEPREIALVIDSTPNAISLRLTRAKQKLANSLERQNRPASGHSPDKQVPESSVGEM